MIDNEQGQELHLLYILDNIIFTLIIVIITNY